MPPTSHFNSISCIPATPCSYSSVACQGVPSNKPATHGGFKFDTNNCSGGEIIASKLHCVQKANSLRYTQCNQGVQVEALGLELPEDQKVKDLMIRSGEQHWVVAAEDVARHLEKLQHWVAGHLKAWYGEMH